MEEHDYSIVHTLRTERLEYLGVFAHIFTHEFSKNINYVFYPVYSEYYGRTCQCLDLCFCKV